MISVLEDDAALAAAVAALVAREPRFAIVVNRTGLPPLRRSPQGFAELLKIITEQAISLKAAAQIWNRISTALDPVTPARVEATEEGALIALGLSGAKARCFRALASAAVDGRCPVANLAGLPDDAVRAALTAVPGIGPWTAEIYLLASLGRADVWPAGDIALQEAARDLLQLAQRPKGRVMIALAEPWRPWRAVAARLLWAHYRHLKAMLQTPV